MRSIRGNFINVSKRGPNGDRVRVNPQIEEYNQKNSLLPHWCLDESQNKRLRGDIQAGRRACLHGQEDTNSEVEEGDRRS